MSLFRTLTVVALLSLAACGFQPMYGESSLANTSPLRGNVEISPIAGHNGQLLKAALEDQLNPEGLTTSSPTYHLSVTLVRTLIPSVVLSDGTIQRYDIRFDSSFTLIKTGSSGGPPEYAGSIHRTASYNASTNANFSTYEAGQDTSDRMLKEVAEDYVLRLTGHFAQEESKPQEDVRPQTNAKPQYYNTNPQYLRP